VFGGEKREELAKLDPSIAKYLKKHGVVQAEQPKDSSESRRSLNVSAMSTKTQVYKPTD
jgi:hypothetical protein